MKLFYRFIEMIGTRFGRPARFAATLAVMTLFQAAPALATQTHSQPEGLYVHQMAHVFFIVSMGILEFWLRQRNLVTEPGWRYIQLAAVLFILWNIDTIVAHLLDEQVAILRITTLDAWHIRMVAAEGYEGLAFLYYLVKLDHLLCVPAMFCLFFGLKMLIKDSESAEKRSDLP